MDKYSEIINTDYRGKQDGCRMTMQQRAAQFAPFAALTGHGAAINETARLTDTQIELSESEKNLLDKKMSLLQEHLKEHPVISITYFIDDPYKPGGRYVNQTDRVKKYDDHAQSLVFEDGTIIRISKIIDAEGEVFKILNQE